MASKAVSSISEIRRKFISGVYDMGNIPQVLEVDFNGDVYVHKSQVKPNLMESLEDKSYWNQYREINQKLKGLFNEKHYPFRLPICLSKNNLYTVLVFQCKKVPL